MQLTGHSWQSENEDFSASNGLNDMKFGLDLHGSNMMNLPDFGDAMTFTAAAS